MEYVLCLSGSQSVRQQGDQGGLYARRQHMSDWSACTTSKKPCEVAFVGVGFEKHLQNRADEGRRGPEQGERSPFGAARNCGA